MSTPFLPGCAKELKLLGNIPIIFLHRFFLNKINNRKVFKKKRKKSEYSRTYVGAYVCMRTQVRIQSTHVRTHTNHVRTYVSTHTMHVAYARAYACLRIRYFPVEPGQARLLIVGLEGGLKKKDADVS